MKTRFVFTVMLSAVLVAGCGGGAGGAGGGGDEAPAAGGGAPSTSAPPPKAAGPATGSSSVGGKVMLAGSAPKAKKIQMSADPTCLQNHPDPAFGEEVLTNDDGSLRNVFIHVKSGLSGGSYPVPTDEAVLNQKGCTYRPHILALRAGQPLKILNDDGTLHNVHSFPKANKGFNKGMPAFLKEWKTTFDQPELKIKFQCEVHNWMSAWAHVVDHPFFAVTGDGGSFSLENLPAGTYEVEAIHEKYGTQTESVTVGDGEAATVEFTFQAS